MLEDGNIEFDQQANRVLTKLQVREQPGIVHRESIGNRFQVDDDKLLHQQVDLVTTVEANASSGNLQRHLPLAGNTSVAEFTAETFFAGRFE